MRGAWRTRPAAGDALNAYLTQFCHYGDAGQGILEGPGFKNVDFSLLKNIALTGSMRLQFRWEIFNLFNTPQFGVPNSALNASPAFLPSVAGGAFPSQVTPSRGPGSISTLVCADAADAVRAEAAVLIDCCGVASATVVRNGRVPL